MTRNYLEMLHARRAQGRRVCVGLDPEHTKLGLPSDATNETAAQAQFSRSIDVVQQTGDIALAYKPNFAFWAATGGFGRLRELMGFIRRHAPEVPIILDVKRGDIGPTARAYAREAYEIFGADAVTLSPYLGFDSIEPFVSDPNKFAYVLCRTSNQSAGEFQDRQASFHATSSEDDGPASVRTLPLFLQVAYSARYLWGNRNVGLVVGATYPTELAEVRGIVGPDTELLVPGVGTQGGKPEDVVQNGGEATAVNSSGGIMFNPDGLTPREATLQLEAELLAAEAARV